MKRYLTNFKQKVTLNDKELLLSGLTLEAKERMDIAFDKMGLTYNDAITKMLDNKSPDAVTISLMFVYCLIDEFDNPYKDFEAFKKDAIKLKPTELVTIIDNVFVDAMPDFAISEKKNTLLTNMMGWAVILLAMMGLIHTLSWLLQFIYPTLNILN